MQEGTNRKAGTGKSGLALIGICVLVVVVIAAAAWALMQPGVAENVLYVAGIVAVAIVIIAIVAYAAYAIIAIPMYMLKGEEYQEDVDYSIDDVKAVEGKSDKDERRDL